MEKELNGVLYQTEPIVGKSCNGCAFQHDFDGCQMISEQCDGIVWVEAPNQKLGQPPIGIGDVNSDAKGSGARYNSGKADLSLIPISTLEDEARVWMYGKEKYAAWNWAKGMAWSVPFACAMRHLSAWQAGEDIDAESGQPHLAHAMCNLRMLTLYSKTYLEGDDRPPKELLK